MAVADLAGSATIWYQRTGWGRPLLHIHGSAFGHRNFERLTPLMAEGFEVIDFDLPGYGESVGPPGAATIESTAEQVAGLISALDLAPLHIHGTSFGAMVALTLAARQPRLVDRLVLSCFLARYDRAARMMRATWKRAATEIGMEAVADLTSVAGFARGFYDADWAEEQLASMRAAFSRTAAPAFVAATEAIEAADLGSLVDLVEAPVLMLAGREDNMTPFAPAPSGLGMADVIRRRPTWEHQVIEGSGHYLVLEQPAVAAGLITEFLTRT